MRIRLRAQRRTWLNIVNMKKRPGFKAMAISSEEEAPQEQLKASLAFTAGGSLEVRDFHMNSMGMVSGIKLDEMELGKELGRGASSVVYQATHKATGQNVAVKMLTNSENPFH